MATPDHRYAISEMTSLAHAPLRFYDLKPALDGEVPVIREPIGEWTADWKKSSHKMEIRWPYVFVSAYEDGLQIINMRDPTNPRTVGYYDTYDEVSPYTGGGVANGAFGIDVRNADGLIVISDMHSGFWAFRMDGFNGWDGNTWGMPNISSVQDWDNGPPSVRERPPSTKPARSQPCAGPRRPAPGRRTGGPRICARAWASNPAGSPSPSAVRPSPGCGRRGIRAHGVPSGSTLPSRSSGAGIPAKAANVGATSTVAARSSDRPASTPAP